MAEIARSEPTEQERLSHEMGLHTEQLKGRSRQAFFDIDLSCSSARWNWLPCPWLAKFNLPGFDRA